MKKTSLDKLIRVHSSSFDFLADEPDLYSKADVLKEKKLR